MKRSRTVLYLLFTDWVILVGSFAVALYFRHYNPSMNIVSPYHLIPEISMMMLYAFIMLGVFSSLNLYKRKMVIAPLQHLLKIIKVTLITVLIYMLVKSIVISNLFIPSRLVLFQWGIFLLAGLSFHRLLIVPVLYTMLSKTDMRRRVVVIGDTTEALSFINDCKKNKSCGINVIGFMADTASGETENTVPFLGCPSTLPEGVNLYHIEGAVICNPKQSYQELMDLVEQCVRLFGWVDIHTDNSAVLHDSLDTDTYFDIPFIRMHGITDNILYKIGKRIFDCLMSLLGILVLSPLLIGTVIGIKLTSPGPILYKSSRIGHLGNKFIFYKFRSMRVGADQDKSREAAVKAFIESGSDTIEGAKIVNTAQVTKIGKFIRKWAIDELPQLFNVLKGDMALVGPRPVPPNEYDINDEWQKRRFDIIPGCTGLWKIYASKNGCAFNHTVLYDLYYARNMSPAMDLYVILGTIKVILLGKADA